MSSDKIKPVAVVLTAYNSMPHIELAINSLLSSTNHPLKIIIIESESTDGTAERCDKYAKNDERIKVIHNKKEGVTKAVNDGIKEAGDLDVFLTQCDVIFPKRHALDWLRDMVMVSKTYKNCGIVTCHGGGNISGPTYINGFPYTGTWAMFLPRKTINKIGLFDEDFQGPGDDIDYSYRLNLAGLHSYVINYWVDHHRMLEYQKDEDKEDKFGPAYIKNAEFFKKKWGLDKPPIIEIGCNGMVRTFEGTTLLDSGYTKEELKVIHHDKEVFDVITRVVPRFSDEDVYIDVGAGVGDTSVWVEKGVCFAFEPGRNYQHLLTNMRLNPKSKVIPINLAVYSNPIHYEIIEKEHFGADEIKETEDKSKPQAVVLDERFKEIPNIKLIKIDVESASLEVLKGAIKIIKKNRPIMIIEIAHCDARAVEKILRELNYIINISKDNITCIGIPN